VADAREGIGRFNILTVDLSLALLFGFPHGVFALTDTFAGYIAFEYIYHSGPSSFAPF
jgi:hypothetical protein